MGDDPICVRCGKPRSSHNYFGEWGYLCHNGSNTFKEPPAARPTAPGIDDVLKAAMVAVIASGQQRKLRPSQIVSELLADDVVIERLGGIEGE